MSDILASLLGGGDFMPHGCCYLWTTPLIWLNVASDALISVAYFTIPLSLIHLVRRRRDISFDWVLLSFGIFILACGATHVMEVITVWRPLYWISGAIKAITAVASIATAILLVRLLPRLIAFPSIDAMAAVNLSHNREIAERTRAQHDLREANDLLEQRIRERTADLEQSNLALRVSEQRYRMIVETAEEGIWLVDAEWRTTFANAKLGAMLGYRTDELLGRPISEFMDEEGKRLAEPNTRRREQGLSDQHEFKFQRRDGTAIWTLLATNPIRDAAGRHAGALAMVSDITQRKRDEARLLQSERRHRELFEANLQPLWLYRTDTLQIVQVNDAAVAQYGYTHEAFLRLTLRDLCAPEDHAAFERDLLLASHGLARGIYRHRRHDGTRFDVEVTSHRFGEGLPEQRLVMALDVTARLAAEQAIVRLNAELEERVRVRTAELTTVNRELESFCYSVSHDLRTPLRAINGFSQLVLDDCGDRLDETSRANLERVRKASARMATLIDDLLALSRLARAELRLEQVDLSALAASVAETIRAGEREGARQVEMAIAPGMSATGDPGLLRVALENLLGNAWKFTSRQAQARISFSVRDEAGTRIWVVRDNGVGFDPGHASNLFGAFQRLHAIDEFPGSGIGLASAKRIIERHGGRLWADSRAGQGAVFSFTLADTLLP